LRLLSTIFSRKYIIGFNSVLRIGEAGRIEDAEQPSSTVPGIIQVGEHDPLDDYSCNAVWAYQGRIIRGYPRLDIDRNILPEHSWLAPLPRNTPEGRVWWFRYCFDRDP